jgi:hypothetical protein
MKYHLLMEYKGCRSYAHKGRNEMTLDTARKLMRQQWKHLPQGAQVQLVEIKDNGQHGATIEAVTV